MDSPSSQPDYARAEDVAAPTSWREPSWQPSDEQLGGTRNAAGPRSQDPELGQRLSTEDIVVTEGPGHTLSVPLHVSVRWNVLLAVAVAVSGVITALMVLCYDDGVAIHRLESHKSEAEKTELLKDLNSASGSIASAVMVPIQIAVAMYVAVATLCFSAKWAHSPVGRRITREYHLLLPLVTAGVSQMVIYLLGNGLSALSIQLVTRTGTAQMAEADLSASSNSTIGLSDPMNDSLATTWDASFAETSDNNSVLNTILRTKLVPFEDVLPTCVNKVATINYPLDPPLLSFGFESQPWHLETLQYALSPTKSLEYNLNDISLPSDDELPMDVSNATYLVVAAQWVVTELLGSIWYLTDSSSLDSSSSSSASGTSSTSSFSSGGGSDGSSGESSSSAFGGSTGTTDASNGGTAEVGSSAAAQDGISSEDFINTSTAELSSFFATPAVISTRLSYKHIVIADSVVFDALTLDIETNTLDWNGFAISNQTSLFTESCNSEGCMSMVYSEEATIEDGVAGVQVQPLVYAGATCINKDGTMSLRIDEGLDGTESEACYQRSNTSMLLIGLGKRIIGDQWDTTDDGASAELTGLKMVYSVTLGLLSWSLDANLATTFAAKCKAGVSCEGVHARLDPSKENSTVLIAGADALPLDQLDRFTLTKYYSNYDSYMGWKRLVTTSPHLSFYTGSGVSAELLFPRRFSTVTDASKAMSEEATNCSKFIDQYIMTVAKNHLYAEDSLQMTYTAGFFFLFQNAVPHSWQDDDPDQLALEGDIDEVYVRALIPPVNAFVSVGGCVLLLLMAGGVIFVGRHSTRAIEENADAAMVADVVLNKEKYPPAFLTMTVADVPASAANVRIKGATFAKKPGEHQQHAQPLEFVLKAFE